MDSGQQSVPIMNWTHLFVLYLDCTLWKMTELDLVYEGINAAVMSIVLRQLQWNIIVSVSF
jgi:hypothetical protein